MCLKELRKFSVKLDENGVGIGWKVFYKDSDGTLCPEVMRHLFEYKRNGWYRAKLPKKIPKHLFGYYPYFHIFLARKDARKWKEVFSGSSEHIVIRKVKFKEPIATGIQTYCMIDFRCVVAKKMLITDIEG